MAGCAERTAGRGRDSVVRACRIREMLRISEASWDPPEEGLSRSSRARGPEKQLFALSGCKSKAGP